MRFFDQFKKGESVLDLGYLAKGHIQNMVHLRREQEYNPKSRRRIS